jgi:DNA-binding Xre family transcriptional regulator
MDDIFSSAKILAQVKLSVPLHGQQEAARRNFSMSKKQAQRKPKVVPPPPPQPLQRTFIQEWRKVRNLSQGKLGEAVGLSTASISQIENAETGYSQRHLEEIARVLDVHPIDLLVCDPNKYPNGIWHVVDAILAKVKF